MKMQADLLDRISEGVAPLDTDERRSDYRDRGLSDDRYRWDLLWAIVDAGIVTYDDLDGLKDAHIATGLKRSIAPLS